MYRAARSSGVKLAHAFTDVLFDGVRSADPPMSSGRNSAVALSATPNALRLATAPFSLVKVGSFFDQSDDRLPESRRSSSVASSGNAFLYAASRPFHSAWAFA